MNGFNNINAHGIMGLKDGGFGLEMLANIVKYKGKYSTIGAGKYGDIKYQY
jgi:hypothetical protein